MASGRRGDGGADEAFLPRIAARTIATSGGYCYEVARLVFLETLKGRDSKRAPLDEAEFTASAANVAAELAEAEEHGRRLECLEHCLRRLPVESRELITEYYRDDRRDRIERRTTLAARLGIRRGALANRAQRMRDKLERCVTICLKKKRRDKVELTELA